MPIESKQLESGVAVVAVSGRLTFGREAEKLEQVINNLLQQGQKRFVFDASALDYADSSGIGSLVSCLTQIKKSGGDLRLAGANARIQRLLSMTGVDRIVSMYPSVADAAAAG